jgi:acyl-CoA dehydrogenase
MGLAEESAMQMYFRDARLQLFSPVSNEMVRNFLGEAMGLPRSY